MNRSFFTKGLSHSAVADTSIRPPGPRQLPLGCRQAPPSWSPVTWIPYFTDVRCDQGVTCLLGHLGDTFKCRFLFMTFLFDLGL